jgi:SAM-dependent methyltransferase
MGSNGYAIGDALLENIRLWDELADRIKSSFPLDELNLLGHFRATDHLLDYGCGTGRIISFLYEHGFKDITGCDTSFRMCEISRITSPQNRISWLENPNCLLPADTFDGVILVGVLSSIVPNSERRSLIERLATRMRKGAKIVVGDFGCSRSAPYPERYRTAVIEPQTFQTEDGFWIHHFELAELAILLSDFFSLIEGRTIGVTTVHGRCIPGHVIVAARS